MRGINTAARPVRQIKFKVNYFLKCLINIGVVNWLIWPHEKVKTDTSKSQNGHKSPVAFLTRMCGHFDFFLAILTHDVFPCYIPFQKAPPSHYFGKLSKNCHAFQGFIKTKT